MSDSTPTKNGPVPLHENAPRSATIPAVVVMQTVLTLAGVSEPAEYRVELVLNGDARPDDERRVTVTAPITVGGAVFERTATVRLGHLIAKRTVDATVLPIMLDDVAAAVIRQPAAPPPAPVVHVDVHVPPSPPPAVHILNTLEQPPRRIELERDPKGNLKGATVVDA